MSEPSSSTKTDYSFGQVAIRENICTFEQVKECLDIQSKLRGLGIEPKKLGEILIEKGYLSPEQAVQVAKLQMQTGGASRVQIPGYELISKIGQGAMGTVYKAKQVSMDRVVAIKVLASKYGKDRSFVDRFLREARAVAKLNHENVISGIDVGECSGLHYFVMEYVDGVPVITILKREGRLDERRCLQIGQQVAKALSHAHRHGIVHRDIKPENIMMTSAGMAKLCDLGLAKQTKGDADVTMDGTCVGTPNYISPEQARGEDKIDIRTDIYSLGASLYHMATGGTPFNGANPMVVMTKHVTEFADPPKKRCPALSEGFSNLVMKMMQKRREDRYQDPDAVVADMERLLNGGDVAIQVTSKTAHGTGRASAQPSTHPAPRAHPPTTHHHAPTRKSSSAGPIAIAAAIVVAAVVAFFVMSPGSSDPTASAPPTPPVKPPVIPTATPDATARVKKELQDFRDLIDSQLGNTTIPDRFTSPYATIHKRIEHYKNIADFVAQKEWQQELGAYVAKVNDLISKRVYAPIRDRADKHFNTGAFGKAATEMAAFEDVYKYFKKDAPAKKTLAGEDCDEFLAKISSAQRDAFLASVLQADIAFKDPARRDEAYNLLDAAADGGTPPEKADIEQKRLKYIGEDVTAALKEASAAEPYKKALDRIAALRAMHERNGAAMKHLDDMAAHIRKDAEKTANSAVSQASILYSSSFRPKFDDAIKRRDVVSARKSLFEIYFGSSLLQATFLPAPSDTALLKGYLDPARTAPADTRKIVALAEEGIKFTALRLSQYESAREIYVDLRITALVEEFLEQAGEGARVASRDAAKFKTGYSAALQSATLVEPAPRKPGDGPGLLVTVGTSKNMVPLAPAGKGALPEEDIVALARRAPGAANDPHFSLKAFYVLMFADRLAVARDWLEKLTTPEARLGTERYVDRFKGMTSAREEADAAKLFSEAWDLYHKRKDTVGGARKFKECAEKYSGTDFMKVKVPPHNRTRLEIVEEFFGGEGKPKSSRSGLRDAFASTDVRELGRGRYEVTYTFKDDKEYAMFAVAEGNPQTARTPNGVQLAGDGQWCWSVPLKGNAAIEVAFRTQGDGSFGLILHGDAGRTGYIAIADLTIPGVPSNDVIFRLPVAGQVQTALVAQGGSGLQLQRGQSNLAAFTRDGTRLRFTLGKGQLEGDHNAFNEGRAGIGIINNSILVERIKITGEVDAAWLDAAVKNGSK